MSTILIRNGSLVRANGVTEGDIFIEDDFILHIAAPNFLQWADTIIDATGKLVFPGFIDVNTHFQMNDKSADDFTSGTKAALLGGVTTVLDMAVQQKGQSMADALDAWRQKADGHCACNYGFHMAVTDWNDEVKEEMPLMTAKGVTSYKVYMTGEMLRMSDADILSILKAAKEQHTIVACHCETDDLIQANLQALKADGKLGPDAQPKSRPDYVEADAISRYLTLCELAGSPAYVLHVSTKRGLDVIRAARERGQTVYAETCPQYLLLNEDRCAMPEGGKFVCEPPLRSNVDVTALWEAAGNDEIDIIASDHSSYNYSGCKDQEDFTQIPAGMPGVETCAPLSITFGGVHGIDATKIYYMMCDHPARLFGLYPRKGVLAGQSDADLVIWDPNYPQSITTEEQTQNVDYTPFDGFPLMGRVDTVIVNGQIAVQDGQLVNPTLGRYVTRNKFCNYKEGELPPNVAVYADRARIRTMASRYNTEGDAAAAEAEAKIAVPDNSEG